MTKEREEAINYLKNSMAIGEDDCSRYHNETLEFVIKELKQKPCEDCWSKKEVVDIINRQKFGIQKISMGIIKEKLEALPSVTPTRKKGKWIAKENIHGLEKFYECSNCGNHCLYKYVEIGFQNAKTKFCPNCGAEMESEEDGND